MPKILWLSPYSLHDTSSGASVQAKDMLEALVKKGFEVWSCSSFVFDNVSGTGAFGDLEKKLQEDNHQTFILDDNGIHYVYTRCQSRAEMQFTLAEGQLLYETFLTVLDEFRPDIILGYCPAMTPLACNIEARRRGIKCVYLLANGNHSNFSFYHYDLVITDSQATADLYAQRDHINVATTGIFINPNRVVSADKAPKYITFINPVGSKGLPIFAKLAKVCQSKFPQLRFLVINSRGNFAQTVTLLHDKDNQEQHPFSAADFPNVDMAGNQRDMRPVFKVTKLLLVPSVAYESWGRVASEAILNDIPVVCSKSGGIPEAMAGCGIALDPPKHCQEDNWSIPSDEEIEPWVNAVQQALEQDYSEQFAKAKEQHSLERSCQRVIELFMPLLTQASDHPLFYRK